MDVFVEEGIEYHQQKEGKGDIVKKREKGRKDGLEKRFGKREPIEIDWNEKRADIQRAVGSSR